MAEDDPVLENDNLVLVIDTILQYHLSIPDPDALPLWEWAGRYATLINILEAERNANK